MAGHQQLVASLCKRRLHSLCTTRKNSMIKCGYDAANCMRSSRGQSAGSSIGLVIKLCNGRHHLFSRLVTNQIGPAEYA